MVDVRQVVEIAIIMPAAKRSPGDQRIRAIQLIRSSSWFFSLLGVWTWEGADDALVRRSVISVTRTDACNVENVRMLMEVVNGHREFRRGF